MARKIKIKRSSTSTDTEEKWLLHGKEVQVGDEVLVQHYSTTRWVKATIKEIKVANNGKTVFYFFLLSPGWVALYEGRIKFPPKVRIKTKQKGDG